MLFFDVEGRGPSPTMVHVQLASSLDEKKIKLK